MYKSIDNEKPQINCMTAVMHNNFGMCHRTPLLSSQNDVVIAIRLPSSPLSLQLRSALPQLSTNFKFVKYVDHRLWRLMALITCLLLIWDNCIGVAHALPQSCVLCDKKDLKAKEPSSANAEAYEEFLFEHQVTRQEAIQALKRLNQSTNRTGGNSCKTVTCTKKIMKYCSGPQFINDHCLCELGHIDEGLPFIPHICYVGEKIETPAVGSCFIYEEVKDCCCAPSLAKEWRHIAAASKSYQNSSTVLKMFVVLSIAVWFNFMS